jgi:hypothetical protein
MFLSYVAFNNLIIKLLTMMDVSYHNSFPHAVLTPLPPQRPTAATLELLQQQLSANTISVPTARGNGLLGHYSLVVTPVEYTIAAQIQFIPPHAPGVAPVHQQGATSAQFTEENRQFLASQKEFAIYTLTETKLKQLVLQAVPVDYTNALKTNS